LHRKPAPRPRGRPWVTTRPETAAAARRDAQRTTGSPSRSWPSTYQRMANLAAYLQAISNSHTSQNPSVMKLREVKPLDTCWIRNCTTTTPAVHSKSLDLPTIPRIIVRVQTSKVRGCPGSNGISGMSSLTRRSALRGWSNGVRPPGSITGSTLNVDAEITRLPDRGPGTLFPESAKVPREQQLVRALPTRCLPSSVPRSRDLRLAALGPQLFHTGWLVFPRTFPGNTVANVRHTRSHQDTEQGAPGLKRQAFVASAP
jgi:hypothetical protein